MGYMLGQEIQSFSARDFVSWLEGGMETYLGKLRLPASMRLPDAFEFAELYIGRNENDLAADLRDVYFDLAPVARAAFKRGLALLWSELEFKEERTFRLADTLLVIACRLPAKGMVDVLAEALPWLAASAEEFAKPSSELRRQSFQAAVELATGTAESIRCLEAFLTDTSMDEDLLARGQALKVLRYMALKAPERLVYWCALFGNSIVADVRTGSSDSGEIREAITKAYGPENLQRVIDLVRIDRVGRLATDTIAMTQSSVDGLYNLVSLVDPRLVDVGRREAAMTLPWGGESPQKSPPTAKVYNFETGAELVGRN